MYALINRADWSVIAKAPKKNALPKVEGGLVVDTAHLERLNEEDALTLYMHLPHGKALPSEVVAKIKAAIEANGPQGASKPLPWETGKATPGKTGDAPAKRIADEGPVAIVRAICKRMKNKARKDVIAACVAAGINPNTAKTQYQRWFAANKK